MVDVFAGLRGRVRDRFGGAEPLRALGHQFGDWLERGPQHANPATVVRVETVLARYLAEAADVGRLWGGVVGVAGGLLAGLSIGAATWAWQVIG